jgi:flagellar basal-body rod modification protein FlgD
MSVVGSKFSTKRWSDSKPSEITKSDGIKKNSATDLQQLDGKDIGEILNQVADPNYVDQKKQIRAIGSDKLDKEAFMKLMLAQMKNQDPTSPLKSHEMAAQLAQFTSLEQLQNMNTTLTEIHKGQKPSETFQTLNFIGKSVSGDSAKLLRLKGDKQHDFNFALPEDAKDIQIKIRNENGDVVRKIELHDMKKGGNRWVWNGNTENGTSAPVGEYSMLIEAKDKGGKKLAVKTDFDGVITGVSYSPEGPVLLVGNQTVKLKDVRKIVDPRLNQKDQKAEPVVPQDLKTQQGASENESKGAEEAPASVDRVMSNVAMTNGMMEKLKKDIEPQNGEKR